MLDFFLQNLIFVFGFITALMMLVYNYRTNRHIVLVFVFLILTSLVHLMLKLMISGEHPKIIAVLFFNISPISLLTGPSIYLFFRKLINPELKFRRIDLLHIFPAFLSLLSVIPYILTPFEYKLNIAHNLIEMPASFFHQDFKLIIPNKLNFAFKLFSNIIYICLSFNILYKYQKKLNDIKQKVSIKHDRTLIWIWLLLFIFLTLLTLIIIVISGLFFMEIINKRESYIGSIAMALRLIFLAIPISILIFPNVLTELNLRKLVVPTQDQKEKSDSLLNDILEYMQTQHPYLDPKFNRNDLCKALGISLQQMQFCLNQSDTKNFVELKNKFRIEHAKQLLQQEASKYLTLESIANESGFSSYSNFNASFKESTGMTPNQWLKSLST